MELKERITRAKVKLQKEKPFFAYLILNMNFKEANNEVETCAVDNKGNLYYNEEWLSELNDEQLKTCFSHEVLHIALLHLLRYGNRDKVGWNIATDLVINTILDNNGFEKIKCGIYSKNDSFEIGKITIEEISKKSAEAIYDEFPQQIKEQNGFDVHIYCDKGDKEQNDKEQKAQESKWKRLITEAHTYSKNIGKETAGIDRQIGDLLDEKVGWKSLLHKYITRTIPYDYSYCLDKDSRINNKKGFKKLKEIRVGDIIFGYNGKEIKETKVKKVFNKTIVKKKYALYTKNGNRIVCSENHHLLTPQGYIKAKDLGIGNILLSIKERNK